MRVHFKAIESYSSGSTATQAAVANRVELIQMLFDGLIDSLNAAKGHIEHRNIEEKSKALARASRIVVGLQAALDLDKGGDLAANLNELYGYLVRRILHVNIHNDLLVLEEVRSLISEVREAWRQVPSLLPAGATSLQH
ncbi:MAG: flagellar export chaperone FliS [Betaproteobacteria bacterium]